MPRQFIRHYAVEEDKEKKVIKGNSGGFLCIVLKFCLCGEYKSKFS